MFTPLTQKEKLVFDALKAQFGYTNPMQVPRLTKVVVGSGVGSIQDKNKIKLIEKNIALIAGQKPSSQLAKKSIATFKVRAGQLSGYRVTLRGEKARSFVDKLIHIALPRTRDFLGVSKTSVDEMGNFTIGIKENNIFPETTDQDVKDSFGLGITIGVKSNSPAETLAYLEFIGIPFKKG
jgi:large subunit ribosomal protein L5